MNIEQFTEIAAHIREAIESFPEEVRPIGLSCFPKGACGDATLLLGTFLIDQGEEPFDYMQGCKGENKSAPDWSYHTWLQRGSLVIDITVDQLPEISEKIIVSENSAWHDNLCGTTEYIANFRDGGDNLKSPLGPFYKKICEVLGAA